MAQRNRQQVVWTVGMTWWRLAEDVYGDGSAWIRIAEANPGYNPARMVPGTVLDIPMLEQAVVGR